MLSFLPCLIVRNKQARVFHFKIKFKECKTVIRQTHNNSKRYMGMKFMRKVISRMDRECRLKKKGMERNRENMSERECSCLMFFLPRHNNCGFFSSFSSPLSKIYPILLFVAIVRLSQKPKRRKKKSKSHKLVAI